MPKYLCLAANGTAPPKHEHSYYEHAVEEAKRLHETLKTDVKILKVVGEVKSVEVPVTRTETKITLDPNEVVEDDLPF